MALFNILFYLCFLGLVLDHLILGGLFVFLPERAKSWLEHFYGLRIAEPLTLFLKPWGILNLFAAAVGIVVVSDLLNYKAFILVFALLLLARLILRFVLAREEHERFKLSLRRNLRHTSVLLLCFLTFIGKYLSF